MAKRTCFVIMPFARGFKRHYTSIYAPAIKAAGLSPKRGDSNAGPEPILESIYRDVMSAQVVLADLSGGNLNVLYEIGYAHGKRKPVVLVSGSLKDIPSDINHIRVVGYTEGKPGWQKTLRAQVTEAILAVIANPRRYRPSDLPVGAKARTRRAGTTARVNHKKSSPILHVKSAAVQAAEAASKESQPEGPKQSTTSRGYLRVSQAAPSQVKQLAALLKDYFKVQLQWKGAGETYELWWDQAGAPDLSRIAQFAEMLNMVVSREGYSA